jgi:hypothetical protein
MLTISTCRYGEVPPVSPETDLDERGQVRFYGLEILKVKTVEEGVEGLEQAEKRRQGILQALSLQGLR